MQRSLFKFSILFMLPIAVAIGIALQQSFQQLNHFSQQQVQKQAHKMADFYAMQVNNHVSNLLNQLKKIIKQKHIHTLLQNKEYTQVKKIVEQNIANTKKVLFIPKRGQGLSAKSVPPSVMHSIKSHVEARLVLDGIIPDNQSYYLVYPVINKGLVGYLVLQRNLQEILAKLYYDPQTPIRLYQDRGEELIPIGHSDLTTNQQVYLGISNIKKSDWKLHIEWQTATTLGSHFFLSMLLVYGLLLAVAIICMYGFYKFAMGNIGKDLTNLRQIMRDIRQGSIKDKYECRLIEFRAAFGTFQRIAKEISEDHGFMSSKGRDPLTGLPNRESLDDYLGSLLMRLYEKQKGFTVFILEINEIDDIAQSYGYHSRDAVMAKIASDLKTALRKSDHIARLDENLFAIAFTDTSSKLVERLERRLKKYLSQFVELADDIKVRITWSSGYCIANNINLSLDEVYDQAIESLAMAHSQRSPTSTTASVQVSK